MPERYIIDADRRLVISTAWDRFCVAEFLDHRRRLLADPAFDPHFRQLVDLTAVTEFALTSADIAYISQQSAFAPGTRRAFVAPPDLLFGVSRMFGSLSEQTGQEIRVFRRRAEAERWLEQEPLQSR